MHVEQVLLESDFNQDVFANEDAEKSPGGGHYSAGGSPVQRVPSALSQFSAEGVSVVKKDTNWDFADVDRPPIYTVDVQRKGGAGERGGSDTDTLDLDVPRKY